MGAVEKVETYTIEEYLAIEAESDFKSIYFNGEIFAMAGANPRHNTIVNNLIGTTSSRFWKRGCRSFGSDQRIFVHKPMKGTAFLYPDFSVVCGPPHFAIQDRNSLINPNAIVEVLSDSTEGFDFGKKANMYWNLASLVEYVLVAQVEPKAHKFTRRDSHHWDLEIIEGLEASFTLLDIEVSMAELYQFVEFGPEEEA